MLKIIDKNFFLILLGLLFIPLFSSAEVLITEVMYDLTGDDKSREWIEIYNNGTSEVTIPVGGENSAWRFSDGTQHSFSASRGSSKIIPGSYAIIVDNTSRFLSEWPNFNGTIFDSSLSLNNMFGELSLLSSKNGSVINKVTYYSNQGASGDGNSLQLQENGNWIPATPTPGSKNSGIANTSAVTGNKSSNSSPSAHYGSIETSRGFKTPTLGLSVGRERVGAFGSPMEFKAETNLDTSKYNTFAWNFGDGSQGGGSILSHTYQYPGDYVVILNASFQDGNAISRVNVKIVDPSLTIVNADPEKITLKNNSAYEVSLFGRALVSGEKFFVFLKDTIIGPSQSLSFGSNVTGLTPTSPDDVLIAVIGDTEQPKYWEKIQEQKEKQITYIKSKIEALQQKIKEIFANKK
jgi:hypothetical protein